MDLQLALDAPASATDRMTALVRSRLVVAIFLSALMAAIYFGFMALFAFNKPLLGTILMPGLSLCILLGPAVIVSSFVLCLIYVIWANAVLDNNIEQLRR
jgi:uncharacterized membrane protein (DUF485 family)